MQQFRIDITPVAFAEIEAYYEHIKEDSPDRAATWLQKLYQKAYALQTMPERHSTIRENDAFEEDVHQTLHYSHRIIYTIDFDNSLVKIHTVRPAAMDGLQGDEF